MRGNYAANSFYLHPIAVRVVFAPVRNGRRRSRGCHSRVSAESAEGTRLGRGDVGEKIGPLARAGGADPLVVWLAGGELFLDQQKTSGSEAASSSAVAVVADVGEEYKKLGQMDASWNRNFLISPWL